jgi:hypothetical protein
MSNDSNDFKVLTFRIPAAVTGAMILLKADGLLHATH